MHLGAILGFLGVVLTRKVRGIRHFAFKVGFLVMLSLCRPFWSHLGAILGLSWAPLGVVWIRTSRGIRQFAFKVGYLVLLLSLCRPLLGHPGATLS